MQPPMRTSLDALSVMVESEETVAEFYRFCSERFPEHQEFWAALGRQELAHARVINRLIDLVRLRPGEFTPGKSTPIDTIKSFVKRTRGDIETVTRTDLPENKALLMAYHIENTFIELQYADVVKTQNDEYKALMDQVISDTLKHKERIVERMRNVKEAAKIPKKSS